METPRGSLDQVYVEKLRLDGGDLANSLETSTMVSSDMTYRVKGGERQNWLSLGEFFSDICRTPLLWLKWRLAEGL